MDKPILYKDIEINERKFRLNKLDARTGSFLLFRLIKIIAPLFKNLDINKNEGEEASNLMDDINITELVSSICDLPEDDFRFIQDNCLQVIEEVLPAGPSKVIDKYGNYCILDVEFDTMLLMNLTIQSLVFNLKGFFEGSPLTSMSKGLSFFQQNSKI